MFSAFSVATSPLPQNVVLVGAVVGGVGGGLLLMITVLVVIVGVLTCQLRRRGHVKFNVSGKYTLEVQVLLCSESHQGILSGGGGGGGGNSILTL